jgi:hypothetical protein
MFDGPVTQEKDFLGARVAVAVEKPCACGGFVATAALCSGDADRAGDIVSRRACQLKSHEVPPCRQVNNLWTSSLCSPISVRHA